MSKFEITKEWNGVPLDSKEYIQVEIQQTEGGDSVEISCTAPFYNDPPAPNSSEDVAHLWDFEVVEVFFLGKDEQYLEFELNPYVLILEILALMVLI